MKILAFVAIFALSPTVFADSAGLEACAHLQSQLVLSVLKRNNRSLAADQMAEVEKFAKRGCLQEANGLSDEEMNAATQAGVQRAFKETFPGVAIPTEDRPWNDVAMSALVSSLRKKFQDPQLTITNPQVLQANENVLAGQEVALSNGYVCNDVSSKVSASKLGCYVTFDCWSGDKIQYLQEGANCRSLEEE